MALGHERLDVCRLAIGGVARVYEIAAWLEGVHRAARDSCLRASPSIPLNIAMATERRPMRTAGATSRSHGGRRWNAQRSRTY